MRILAIETSCDETAVTLLDCRGSAEEFSATVLGNALYSQVKKHAEFGGVVPHLAKREHAMNLVPLLEIVLAQAGLGIMAERSIAPDVEELLEGILSREHSMHESFISYLKTHAKPDIDAVAVTYGPGLEPALWVGINLGKAISIAWDIPMIPTNHMEGHIVSSMMRRTNTMEGAEDTYTMGFAPFPLLALLISGGHTELVLMKKWIDFKVIGRTRDDAVGEAFDKVARMLGLPYPGGVNLSNLAEEGRRIAHRAFAHPETIACLLPRPMINAPNLDFSFSGLKTAVMYFLKEVPELTDYVKMKVAREFEEAVGDVLEAKVIRAIEQTKAKTLVIGGGVSANKHLRLRFEHLVKNEYKDMQLFVPESGLSTDNAVMISMTAYLRSLFENHELVDPMEVRAEGNLRLENAKALV